MSVGEKKDVNAIVHKQSTNANRLELRTVSGAIRSSPKKSTLRKRFTDYADYGVNPKRIVALPLLPPLCATPGGGDIHLPRGLIELIDVDRFLYRKMIATLLLPQLLLVSEFLR